MQLSRMRIELGPGQCERRKLTRLQFTRIGNNVAFYDKKETYQGTQTCAAREYSRHNFQSQHVCCSLQKQHSSLASSLQGCRRLSKCLCPLSAQLGERRLACLFVSAHACGSSSFSLLTSRPQTHSTRGHIHQVLSRSSLAQLHPVAQLWFQAVKRQDRN